MTRKGKYSVIGVMMCSLFFLCMWSTTGFAQKENELNPKLLDELVGAYELKIQGQSGVYLFIEVEGKLKGAPAGEEPLALELVEGEDMTFAGHTPDGVEQFFKFMRNEEGKVAKCILSIPEAGLVVDMFKLERSKL